ncbi:MAG: hypothetical protein CMB73_02825 [Euryarchaeota archaeon]|nr:hypothetical protein [Euryarchaeota archaeon]
MTEESEWPDEVTADEPETELEVENDSTQSSDDHAGNNPSEEESVVSESNDEEENEPVENEENESADEQEKQSPSDDFGVVTLPVRARQAIQISESSFEIPMSQTKDGKKTVSMLIDEGTVRIATTTVLPNGDAESIIDSVYAKEALTGYSFTRKELKRIIPYSAGLSALGLILAIIPGVDFLAYSLLIAGLASLGYIFFDPLMVELSFSGFTKRILFFGLTSDKNLLSKFSEFAANSFPEILNGEVIDTTEIDLLAKQAMQPVKPSPPPAQIPLQAPGVPISPPMGNIQPQHQTVPQTIPQAMPLSGPQIMPQTMPQSMPETPPQSLPQTIPQSVPQSTTQADSGSNENKNLSMLTPMDEVPTTPNKPLGPPIAESNPKAPPAAPNGAQLPSPPTIPNPSITPVIPGLNQVPNPPVMTPMAPPVGGSPNLPPPPQQIPQPSLPAPLPAPLPQPGSIPAPLPTNASFLPPPPTNVGMDGFSDPLGKEFEQNKEPETYVVQGEAVVETLDEGQKDELLKELL